MLNIPASEIHARPAAPGAGLRDLAGLQLMLEQGWQIEAPVLARLSWAQRNTGDRSYHIILTRATRRSLVVIPAHPSVERFLAERGIAVR